MPGKSVLGYWKLRGLGQPIRFLLTYMGDDWEETSYSKETVDDWFVRDKFNLGLDFPNLPYYIDDQVKLSQSSAILRYLGRKHGLVPTGVVEQARIEVLEAQLVDLVTSLSRLCYNPNYNEDLKNEFLKDLPKSFKMLSDFLGNKQFFFGDKVTYVDFMAYEFIERHVVFFPQCLDEFRNLKDYLKRFENLDKIKQYMASDKFISYPINGPRAKLNFNGPK